jgi:hypothetical protein
MPGEDQGRRLGHLRWLRSRLSDSVAIRSISAASSRISSAVGASVTIAVTRNVTMLMPLPEPCRAQPSGPDARRPPLPAGTGGAPVPLIRPTRYSSAATASEATVMPPIHQNQVP